MAGGLDGLQAADAVVRLAHAIAGVAEQRDIADAIVGIVVDHENFVRVRTYCA